MRTRSDLVLVVAAAAALGGLSAVASAQVTSPKEDHDAAAEHEATTPAKTVSGLDYSPNAGRKYPMHVYFGDTHHHTANSGDAFFAGNRLTPEDAYRFARGEEIVSSSGVPDKLSRPLDFLVVSDHAEGLGIGFEVFSGNPTLVSDPAVARWQKMLKAGGKEAKDATNELISAQAQGTLPKPLTDPAIVGPVVKTVWQAYTATADKYNQPGVFTAMIGYEWTSVPGGNNLHRNVLFRDNKDKADQVIPFSAWQSEDPEKLWEWMARYEQKTGGRMLAIPHNPNLSNGRMFAVVDVEGKPLTADYARRRAQWEPLIEVMQTKGNSETHPTLSPNDEFADYGIQGWDNGNLTLEGEPETPAMRQYMYIRGGLLNGLKLQAKLGVNPFKMGMAGGTDVHNSLTSIEENNFFGKHVDQEPRPDRWSGVSKKGLGFTRYNWQYTAAGYTGVWATENTRTALWDAMKRKEVYATSGSRITLRFFGGYDYQPGDARSRTLADAGYAKGVPMGGDLAKAPSGKVAHVPRRRDQGSGERQPRPYPGHQGLAGRQGRNARARLRRRVERCRTSQAGQGRQGAAGRRYRRRRDCDLDRHDRRCGAGGRVARSRLRSKADGLLLRACDRDTDAALDQLRRRALRHQDGAGSSHDAPGAGLELAHLVHAVNITP